MLDEYFKLLNNEDEDMIGGLLKELEMEAPLELHEEVMNKIDKDRSVKNRMKFRRLASLAAGILVVFIGVGFLSKGIGSHKKSTSMYREEMGKNNQIANKKTSNDEMSVAGVKKMDQAPTMDMSITNANEGVLQMERITIKTNQTNIVEFLRKRGEVLSNNLYKLKYKDYEEIKKIEGFSISILPQSESEIKTNSSQEYILIELKEE